jgi:hypothetical protein
MVSQKHGDPICKPSFGIAAYLVAAPPPWCVFCSGLRWNCKQQGSRKSKKRELIGKKYIMDLYCMAIATPSLQGMYAAERETAVGICRMLDVRWALSFRHFPPPSNPRTKNQQTKLSHSPALLHLAFPPEKTRKRGSARLEGMSTPLVNSPSSGPNFPPNKYRPRC